MSVTEPCDAVDAPSSPASLPFSTSTARWRGATWAAVLTVLMWVAVVAAAAGCRAAGPEGGRHSRVAGRSPGARDASGAAMTGAAQIDLFAATERTGVSSWFAWLMALGGLHGRGGFHTMVRMPGDPDEVGTRGSAVARARILDANALGRGDPARFYDAIERLMHADGEPRSFNRISVEVVAKHADITCGGPLEEACWQLIRLKSLRWRAVEVRGFHVFEFAAWRLGDDLQRPQRREMVDHRWALRRRDTTWSRKAVATLTDPAANKGAP